MTYPDNTTVAYEYDANNNLTKVTDWSGRTTIYTYDVNNKVVGVTKPDGSVTTTDYDHAQRITSTVEKTAGGTVITGFAYTYDTLGRISEESHLANNTKMCYTYDNLSRVTKRSTINLSNNSESVETFSYDASGNVTSSVCMYDTNNRLTSYNGDAVTYDADGNMLSAPLDCVTTAFEYDSANRLLTAGGNAYTYNAEDVRIRNLCGSDETIYTYNTQSRLSQLLMKTTNGVVTKYVYGLGLIGEEKQGCFKTYHFDYRGSTVAITNENGCITDTFQYDTYGRLISRTGSSFIIFGYNGRDGVVIDRNGLIYMRARYYSPELRRFVNADIVKGEITNAITLNRYAYANGNPVSNVDPFGLAVDERDGALSDEFWRMFKNDDGTYSLYDNRRHQPNNVFHEQIFVVELSGSSFNLKEGNIGIGSIQGDFMTGGWEWEYVDLSLLDLGHVEAGAELKNGKFQLGAMASAWSPSLAIKILGVKVELGAEVGSIGVGAKASSKGFSIGLAFLFGGKLSVSW